MGLPLVYFLLTPLAQPFPTPTRCDLYQAPLIPYLEAWAWQKTLVQQRRLNPDLPPAMIVCQHPPVYTLGHGATLDHLRFDPHHPPAPLQRIERGGEVTYHCPGQVVLYPILNLKRYQPDLHWYLRQLEGVVIATLEQFYLKGERFPGLTGVWLQGHKICAIGIKVSRWITMHGLAVNVSADLSGFQAIVPCGLSEHPVGNLAQFCPGITTDQVEKGLLQALGAVFHLTFKEQPWPISAQTPVVHKI